VAPLSPEKRAFTTQIPRRITAIQKTSIRNNPADPNPIICNAPSELIYKEDTSTDKRIALHLKGVLKAD
jgi:hypothetical protein